MADIVYRSGIKSGVIAFKARKSITRPADTTAYAISDLINAASATTLIEIDFGTDYANQIIQINQAIIFSNNGTVASKLSAGLYLFNTSTVLGAADANQKDDNAAFAPTMAQVIAKQTATFEDVSSVAQVGTGVYAISSSEKSVVSKLDSSGKIWAAIVANNAYVPISEEQFTIILKGYVLG